MKMICDVPDEVIKSVRMGTWCGSSVAEKMIAKGIPLEQEPCEDAISRQAVLDAISSENLDYAELYDLIKHLSPVNPQEQRTGYWIMHFYEISPSDSTMECSECGEELTAMYVKGDYCPNCGSKNKVKHGDKKK